MRHTSSLSSVDPDLHPHLHAKMTQAIILRLRIERDDVRDVAADPDLLGKPIGRDLALGRPSVARRDGVAGALGRFRHSGLALLGRRFFGGGGSVQELGRSKGKLGQVRDKVANLKLMLLAVRREQNRVAPGWPVKRETVLHAPLAN
jgi:hypothetical protein